MKYKNVELTIKADIYSDATSARDDIREFCDVESMINEQGVDAWTPGQIQAMTGIPSTIKDLMAYAEEKREEHEEQREYMEELEAKQDTTDKLLDILKDCIDGGRLSSSILPDDYEALKLAMADILNN